MKETQDKQDKILSELKHRAEDIRYGTLRVEFKIHEGKIMAGEIIEEKIKLG